MYALHCYAGYGTPRIRKRSEISDRTGTKVLETVLALAVWWVCFPKEQVDNRTGRAFAFTFQTLVVGGKICCAPERPQTSAIPMYG